MAPAGAEKKIFGFSRWDAAAIVGAALSAFGWHFWTTLDPNAGRDGFTQLYILGFTAAVIFLRKPIDALLAPVYALTKHIPRLVLIGIALALPYFLAHYFYKQGHSNYPLMHKSIAWGTILPYILLRIPGGGAGGMRNLTAATPGWVLLGLIAAMWLGDSAVLFAHDFADDFTRIEDGLRTPGWAETIAGTTATAINVLVNGSLVFQQPGKPGPDGEEPTQYTMDIRTEDQRTSLGADGEDRLWMYAKVMCSKASVNAQGLTNAISFTFGGSKYAGWMSINSTQAHSGYKAVLLACTPPSPDVDIEEGAKVIVTVAGATADGQPMHGDVTLDLDPPLKVDIEVLA
ncbi:hypothetical protein [Prosthecobacter sp.]|uniref:hypothetical protein n=1 Tax=Prosthecobacter sp. TaxID=1965333 RepID=UPI002ABBE8F8|nr:hypothetical protein [Prosthecobacter sp.]MDZ4403183.1 hypothetical protein [Prosthecobacter sp.]